jgi:uncharacterized protein
MSTVELPLFPLNTVLYPGGPLKLRVFERRYLDMVRDCSKRGTTFGVCQILKGAEAGAPARPASVGTTARIADFYMLEDGLLGITCRGEQRFHVERVRVRDSGLLIGEVTLWPDERAHAVPTEHAPLATILERLLDDYGELYAPIPPDALSDAGYVSFRLAELLPRMTREEQQVLLETHNPVERLIQITAVLPRYQR